MIRWIFFASLCWSIAAQAEVYKWVDKDGNVHFTDRKPEAEENVETVDTSATELSESQLQAAEQRNKLRKESASTTQAAQIEYEEELSKQRADRKRDKENRAKACAMSRRNLAISIRSTRTYTTDEQGERTYLSDDERVAKTELYRKMIAEFCD